TNETAAHHCQLAGNRVQQADRIVLAGVITLPGLFDKRKIDDFLIVERGHAGPQLVRATQGFGLNTHLCPCTWGLIGNSLEAVDTSHFLDEVFFDGKVEAVAGGRHLEDVVIDRERAPQAAEDVFHFGALERQAQYTAAAFETHAHRLALRKRDDLIIERAHLATANVDDESGHVLEVLGHIGEINAALEAMARLGAELVATGPAHDGLGPPERAFQVDVGGFEGDGGGLTAHDAGHAFDHVASGDHTNIGLQINHLPAQQFERFALARPAHGEAALNAAYVEHVGRATQLEHHVIRNIDQRRNRTLPRPLELTLHPGWRFGTGIDPADYATGKATAQIGRLDLDGKAVFDRGHYRFERQGLQGRAGQRGDFTGHATDRQAVCPVGGELEGEQRVVKVEVAAQVFAHRGIGRQL